MPVLEQSLLDPSLFVRSDRDDARPRTTSAPSPRVGRVELPSLLTRIARGDQDAFSEFYRATSTQVYAQAVRVLRDPEQAYEVRQEVYLQVWQQADRFDATRGSAGAWLSTMTHRRAVDRVRAAVAAGSRDIRYTVRQLERERDEVWDHVATRSDATVVRNALCRLTTKQREAVVLHYFGGHSAADIGALLGVATGTVKTRIRDGLLRLRVALPATP